MTEARWIRVATAAGVAFAALIVVAGPILSRSTPPLSASGQTIFDFVSAHHSRLQLSAGLGALAMAVLIVWLSALFGVLRQVAGAYPGLAVSAVAGGVLAASTGVASAALKAATAAEIDEIGPGSARVFSALVRFTNGGVLFGLAVVIGVTAVATFGSVVVGRWLAPVSAVLAAGSLLGAASIADASDTTQKLSSVFLSLDTLWILVVCALLWRKPVLAAIG